MTVFPPEIDPLVGDSEVRLGKGATTYVKLTIEVLVPLGVVTLTRTVPAVLAGTTTETVVAVDEVGTAVTVPNVTVVAPARLVPEIIAVIPPVVGPEVGLILEIVGKDISCR